MSQFSSPYFNDADKDKIIDFNPPIVNTICVKLQEDNLSLKNEIKNFDSHLQLYGFPSFSDSLNSIPAHLAHNFINNLGKILNQKQKDNEIKVEYLDRINKLESEKIALENTIQKLRSTVNELTEKQKRLEQQMIDKGAKWKEKKQHFKIEKEQEIKLNQKLQMRENQYLHEIKKKEKLINSLNEQIKKTIYSYDNKNTSSINHLALSSPRAEMNLSYSLGRSNSFNHTFISQNNINSNLKQTFIEDHNKNIETKYMTIIKDNERLKSFLHTFHNQFIDLVRIKKESFLDFYKKTFGIDFPNEGNYDLGVDRVSRDNLIKNNFASLDISLDIEPFMQTFNSNFIKLKEFLIRREELNFIGHDNSNSNSDTTSTFNQNDFPNSKNTFLNEKYIQNVQVILENYKKINTTFTMLINLMIKIKQLRDNNQIYDMISHFDKFVSVTQFNSEGGHYINNILTSIEENRDVLHNSNLTSNNINKGPSLLINALDLELQKIKDSEKSNIEKYLKLNENLIDELNGYSRILENASNFCQNN
jgi:hypothetical protein